MTDTTVEDMINAAASIATDAAEGRLDPEHLEQQMLTELRALFGTVVGAGDPLWCLQREIASGVLAAGGIPTDEMAEWLAVQRRRENPDAEPPSAAAPLDGSTTPPEAISSGSGELSPESDALPDDLADVPREVIVRAEAAAMAVITEWRESQR
ncbi:flagellar hook-length control protein [Mycobacteroides chelonae]|nr:flagellar hook-length control protein [Mycobacteroides chelonae]MEC4873533.1 flagellar hook-length control protein [Mycobacteroides chelonae]